MTEEKALIIRNMSLDETLTLGKVLADSGFFKDTRQASQAVVKILAGREMGFGPIASMQGIHIIQGNPSTGANLLGAAIKGSGGRYDYRVVTLTDDEAEIAFFEHGKEIGRSLFSMEDAKRAGLNGKDNWRKFPRNMLFSRAMSNGARWYCPDVYNGITPYTPEELGAEDNGDGDVIDVTPTRKPEPPSETPQKPANGKKQYTRPLDADDLRDVIREKAGWHGSQRASGEIITEKQVPYLATLMSELFPNLDAQMQKKARYDVLNFLIGVTSTKDLSKAEASALIDWCIKDPDMAAQEAARVLTAIAVEQGQQELPL